MQMRLPAVNRGYGVTSCPNEHYNRHLFSRTATVYQQPHNLS